MRLSRCLRGTYTAILFLAKLVVASLWVVIDPGPRDYEVLRLAIFALIDASIGIEGAHPPALIHPLVSVP